MFNGLSTDGFYPFSLGSNPCAPTIYSRVLLLSRRSKKHTLSHCGGTVDALVLETSVRKDVRVRISSVVPFVAGGR